MGGSASGRTWFKWSDQQPGKRPSQSAEYHDFDTTYAHMAAALKEHAPDGVFGFSQGATAAALLMAQLLRRHGQGLDLDVPVPEFGVLVSGARKGVPSCPAALEIQKQVYGGGNRGVYAGRWDERGLGSGVGCASAHIWSADERRGKWGAAMHSVGVRSGSGTRVWWDVRSVEVRVEAVWNGNCGCGLWLRFGMEWGFDGVHAALAGVLA